MNTFLDRVKAESDELRQKPRPETLRTYIMPVGTNLTLKVIEMGRFNAVLECISLGAYRGHQITVDYQRLRIWRAQPIDIQGIKVGAEIDLAWRTNHIGRPAPEVVEWRNV